MSSHWPKVSFALAPSCSCHHVSGVKATSKHIDAVTRVETDKAGAKFAAHHQRHSSHSRQLSRHQM